MERLHQLDAAYRAAKLIYDGCPIPSDDITPDDRIRLDMVRRVALKRFIAAENEYNAALDAYHIAASERTAIGMAAE